METAPLKSYATWARTELIKGVGARIAAVLAPGSTERVEEAAAIKALEAAVKAAGGDAAGRAKVADKVAYTWFNRIVALRFMDANAYTGIGIVSPHRGQTSGQPEVLADAKRGVLDTEIVGKRTAETITALLDGTRRSPDPQGESYSLLLAEHCRYWHRAMPFMFEREGDYTELLIPANLLADDSVLARSVTVLTEEVCKDVEVIGWLYQFYISERKDEVFAGFKKNKKAGADEIPAATQLFTPNWIVRYLVENSLGRLWMLNHPDSRLVDQMDYYIAPVDDETDFLKIGGAEELTVIDPACGSGHMLTYAFDLLYAIYEEQGEAPSDIPGKILNHNLYGTEIDPRAGALAAFALTMKARARQRTFFNKQLEPNICVIDPIAFSADELGYLVTKDGDRHTEEAFWNQFTEADTFGSLIQPDPGLTIRLAEHLETLDDEGDMLRADALGWAAQVVRQATYLLPRYSVVVANPPYMIGSKMSSLLGQFGHDKFPNSKSDLFAMFIERNLDLAAPQGLVGMVTMHSWMFIVSFEKLRETVLRNAAVLQLAHLGESAFDSIGGDVVATTAFVLSNHPVLDVIGRYVRLVDGRNEAEKSADLRFAATSGGRSNLVYKVPQSMIRLIPSQIFAYWLGRDLLGVVEESDRLDVVSDVRQGLSPADKPRFMRTWWEVSWSRTTMQSSSVDKWFPYNKGGGFRKWFGNVEHVINWQNDGAEIRAYPKAAIRNSSYYLRESITWSKVSSGRPSFRHVPAGYMFDGAAGALFPRDPDQTLPLLGVLNSTVVEDVLEAYAPTLNFTEVNIASLPIPAEVDAIRLEPLVQELVVATREDWDADETSWGFTALSRLDVARLAERFEIDRSRAAERVRRIRACEAEIDQVVAAGYGLATWRISDQEDLSDVGVRLNPFASLARSGTTDFDMASRLVSYAVGCMFGRYSLNLPGLILADQAATLQDYLTRVSAPTFTPDADNVLPIVDGDWFEDDIVERFRQFLRVAFGEQHFEENLRFVTEALGVKILRDYFVKSFYKDHVQRYKKRPIYWLFSSPRGSFNALIYMHRYTPSTVSTVLNEYLREFQAKLQASLTQAERSNNAREADRLRKVLVELTEYEHDVLYPLATQQLTIDLDDGVKVNYPKFGDALKKIPGLEASDE